MPRERLYATNAERQAAYNERKRQAERERQAAIRAEEQRQAALYQTAKVVTAQIVRKALNCSDFTDRMGIAMGSNPAEVAVIRQYIDQITNKLQNNRYVS